MHTKKCINGLDGNIHSPTSAPPSVTDLLMCRAIKHRQPQSSTVMCSETHVLFFPPSRTHTQTSAARTHTPLHLRIKRGWSAVMRLNRRYREKPPKYKEKRCFCREWVKRVYEKRREGMRCGIIGLERKLTVKGAKHLKQDWQRGFSFCFRLFLGKINHQTGRDLADKLNLLM